MKTILTNEQVRQAYKLYIKQNKTIVKLAVIYHCDPSTISRRFKLQGFKIKPQSDYKRRYWIDQKYFDNIDSEHKAYFLGFLYADGTNNESTGQVRIGLRVQDIEILQKLSQKIYKKDRVKIYKKSPNLAYLVFNNKNMSKQLAQKGCMKNKTFKLTFPNFIEDHLLPHFMRGFFDGDGSLSYSNTKQKTGYVGKKFYLSFTSTTNMLYGISKLLEDKFQANYYITKRWKERNNDNYSLKMTSVAKMELFCDWMYKDATIFLDRKYKKYLELKTRRRSR
jgi:hypothetical protein